MYIALQRSCVGDEIGYMYKTDRIEFSNCYVTDRESRIGNVEGICE